MTPKISIIVPVYNVEQYLPRCIDSILTQTFSDFELILVNDGSPDRCPNICDEYAIRDARIQVIHKENSGVSNSRNAGIEVSKGAYIAFVDSDDYLDKNYLKSLYDCQCDLAICGRETLDQEGNLISVLRYSADKRTGRHCFNFSDMYQKNMLYSPYSKLFRGDIIRKYKLRYNPDITWGEDGMFVADYLPYVTSLEVLPYTGYCYIKYNSKNNLSTKIRYDIIDMIAFSREYCIEKIKKSAPDAYETVQQVCIEDICFNCAYFLGEVIKSHMKFSEKQAILSHFLDNRYTQQVIANPKKYFSHDQLLLHSVLDYTDATGVLNTYRFLHFKRQIKKCIFAMYCALPQCIKNTYRTIKQRIKP